MPILKTIAYQLETLYLRNSSFHRCIIIILLWVSNWSILAQTSNSREYQIKATFLFNFTQFVEWPTNAFSEDQAPLVIGILGEDPFGMYLDQTIVGEKINNHPLIIQRYRNAEEVKTCHILFINVSKINHLDQVLASLKGRNILTVSDANSFARKGGVIRFFTEDNKMRLQINLEAAKAANLTISSKLLRLADIIATKNN